MPGKDDGAAQPALGTGRTRDGSADDLSRGNRGAGGASKPLSGAHSAERGGLIALGNQILGDTVDQHEAGTRGRPFQPPAILRAPSSLLSRPLFLHPVPQLCAPFRTPSIPPFLPAPLLLSPLVAPPQPHVPADSTAAQTQAQDVPPSAEVPSPKVELSVTSSATDTAPASVETTSSASTALSASSPAPSPKSDSARASTTSASPLDISPIAFATGEPVSASLVDTSSTSPGTSDILPVTNTDVGVGGKVAAACVIGAVFLLLLNWAFWLVIRRRRRARRSMSAHWDFAAPVRAKDVAGRDSEDAFDHSEPDERVAKGGMVTVPI